MINKINEIDTQIFLLLNSWHNNFFDQLMWLISSKTIWIPLYLLFLYLIIGKYMKKSLLIILFCIICIALADFLSVALFKNIFMRLRPSHNPALEGIVHIVNGYKGGSYGFISSHAANTFALAFFINHFLKTEFRYFSIMVFLWAALVSYSRIYLGVHYPGDILGGAVFGIIVSFCIIKLFNGFEFMLKKNKNKILL